MNHGHSIQILKHYVKLYFHPGVGSEGRQKYEQSHHYDYSKVIQPEQWKINLLFEKGEFDKHKRIQNKLTEKTSESLSIFLLFILFNKLKY